jgi:hypothetical protein
VATLTIKELSSAELPEKHNVGKPEGCSQINIGILFVADGGRDSVFRQTVLDEKPAEPWDAATVKERTDSVAK